LDAQGLANALLFVRAIPGHGPDHGAVVEKSLRAFFLKNLKETRLIAQALASDQIAADRLAAFQPAPGYMDRRTMALWPVTQKTVLHIAGTLRLITLAAYGGSLPVILTGWPEANPNSWHAFLKPATTLLADGQPIVTEDDARDIEAAQEILLKIRAAGSLRNPTTGELVTGKLKEHLGKLPRIAGKTLRLLDPLARVTRASAPAPAILTGLEEEEAAPAASAAIEQRAYDRRLLTQV